MIIRRKWGEEQVPEIHPVVDTILKPTFADPAFQEQMMHIVHQIGGFSMTEANVIQKALGKKNWDAIAVFKKHFISGAGTRGVTGPTAERIWSELESASSYLFNK